MSILEHFKDQLVHIKNGVEHFYVLTDKNDGKLEILLVPTTEIEAFLEGTIYDHSAGSIPRFNKPRRSKSLKPSLAKTDGNS